MYCFSSAGLFLTFPKTVQASAVQVNVEGQQITVEAEILLLGGSSEIIQEWQAVLDAIFNNKDFIYKCYTVLLKVELRQVNADEVENEDYVLQVLDISSDPADQAAFQEYGMYTPHDWRLYDRVNNTNVYSDCHTF